MASYQNKISILIAAQDEASGVLAASAAQVEDTQAKIAASNEELATSSTASADEVNASQGRIADGAVAARDTVTAANDDMAASTTASMAEANAAMDEHAAVSEETAAKSAAASDTASSKIGKSSMLIAGAVAVAAGVMVDRAAKFQQAITRLATSAGESTANLKMVGNGVLQVARETGTSTTQLTSALYIIESGGQHGAAGLQVLKAAAEGAKTENADLATVADAVTSAMTDYHYSAAQAATVTSKLVAATGQGKTTFQQLAAAMPAILPTAAAAHISLNEILGDLASMTLHGMSADQAAQNLAHSIRNLQSPTMAMSKEMASLGLNSTVVSQQLGQKGLYGTIQEISHAIEARMGKGSTAVILNMTDALKGLPPAVQAMGQELINGTTSYETFYKAAKQLNPLERSQVQAFMTLYDGMHTIGTEQMTGAQVMQTYAGAMHKALGTADGLNVALMLTGKNSGNTNRAIAAVTAATADASGNVKGWGDIQKNFNQQLSVFKEDIGTTGLAIGEALLPPLTSAFKAVDKILAPIATFISNNRTLAAALMITVGGVASFVAITTLAQKATNAWGDSLSFTKGVVQKLLGPLGIMDAEDTRGLGSAGGELRGVLGGASKVGSAATAASGAVSAGEVGGAAVVGTEGMATAAEGATAAFAGLADVLTGPVGIALGAAVVGGIAVATAVHRAHNRSVELNNSVLGVADSEKLQQHAATDLTSAELYHSKALDAQKTLTDQLKGAQDRLTASKETLKKAQDDVQLATDAEIKAYDKYGVNSPQYIKAVQNLQGAEDNLSKAQSTVSKDQTIVVNVSEKLKVAHRDVANAAKDVTKNTETASKAADTYDAKVAKLHGDQATLVQDQKNYNDAVKIFGANSPAAKQWLAQLDSDTKNLSNDTNGVTTAYQNLMAQWNKVKSTVKAPTIVTEKLGGQTYKIPQYASGTNYAPGGVALVGENGPELVNLPQGSQVLNNNDTSAMMAGAGGRVAIQNFNVYNNTDAGMVVRQIGWQLAMAA